jgi:hypothetical protein
MLGSKLNSWKEIAAYLKCDESTARRWERKCQLPVYRIGRSRGSSVYAYPEEVDTWLRKQRSASGLPDRGADQKCDNTILEIGQEMGTPPLPEAVSSTDCQPDTVIRVKGSALTLPETSLPDEDKSPPPLGPQQSVQTMPPNRSSPTAKGRWSYWLAGAMAAVVLAVALESSLYRSTTKQVSRPTVEFINPTSPSVQNLDQLVTVNGSDFQAGLTLTVNYPGGISTLSGTQITNVTQKQFQMLILLNITGYFSIVVNNPDGAHSGLFSFQVSDPVSKLTVDHITPQRPRLQIVDQIVTVTGSGFHSGLTVTVYYPGGTSRLSGTQIQNVTPTSFRMLILLNKTGRFSIVVNNPDSIHSDLFSFHLRR